MKKLVKSLESLPWIVRVLLVVFFDFYGNLIRLFKSLAKENIIGIILAIIMLISGGLLIFWIIDLVCALLNRPIWWID